MTVKLLALDFDGVLTTNQVYVFQDGSEAVICSRADGIGIAKVKALGIAVIVISAESSPVVGARCRKLGLRYYDGVTNKLSVLHEIAKANGVMVGDIAYVGNDVGDLECLQWVGYPYIVADAWPDLWRHGEMLARKGGEGAVREACELICRMVAKERLLEIRQEQIPTWRSVESEMFDGIRTAVELYDIGDPISEEAAFSIDFKEPAFQDDPMKELQLKEKKMDLGLLNPLDLVKEENPDITTDEEAEEFLNKNIQIRNRLRSKFTVGAMPLNQNGGSQPPSPTGGK